MRVNKARKLSINYVRCLLHAISMCKQFSVTCTKDESFSIANICAAIDIVCNIESVVFENICMHTHVVLVVEFYLFI